MEPFGDDVARSTDQLVEITPKRSRIWKKLFKEKSSTEKKLIFAVLLLSITTISLSVALLGIRFSTMRQKKICYSNECIKSASMFLENMDTRQDPCADFYQFTCGKWSEAHITQSDTNSWFADRTRYISSKIAGILSENSSSDDPQPLLSAKSLYNSCVDTDRLDELGIDPMLEVIEKADLPKNIPSEATTENFSISKVLARIQRVISMDILIQLSMAFDPATNLTTIMISPAVGTSSLPELVSSEEKMSVSPKEAVALRVAYMTGVLSQIDPNANTTELGTTALKILIVDSQIRSDIVKSFADTSPEKMTLSELQEYMDSHTNTTPSLRIDWNEYTTVLLKDLGKTINMNDSIYVDRKEFFLYLAKRLHKSKPETYQRYLWWSLVSAMVPHTTNDLRSLRDDLYEALFKRPSTTRSHQCVKYVKNFFNMAISYKFSKMYNLNETTAKVNWLLDDIKDSFKNLVSSFSWMDRKTKTNAKKKASAIKSFIGYPKWIQNEGAVDAIYKDMEVVDGQFLQSMVTIKSVEVKNILKTVGEPKENKTYEWISDPMEVNAFYGRESNAIAIPAGILQAPFYYLGVESLNYGAIGTILGHELTHAFDIEGKDYDGDGRRVSWWDEAMTKEYNLRAQCFVDQYGKFKVAKDSKLNGSLTLAENIADNGGVREAFHAYQRYIERNGEEPKLPGLERFSHEQLFFIAFANVWCETTTPEDDIVALNDVHSPNKFRVLGTLSNLEEFSRVWNCPADAPMNPNGKCVLW